MHNCNKIIIILKKILTNFFCYGIIFAFRIVNAIAEKTYSSSKDPI
jgi:hypothetical protein